MNKKLRALLDKKAKQVAEARGITTKAEGEGRDLSAEEQTQFDGIMAEVNLTNAAIDRERNLIAQEAQLGISAVTNFQVSDNIEADARRGFQSFGEFASAVAQASINPDRKDQRLAAAPTTFGNESSGADGGYAVPPQYSTDIWRLSLGEDSLVPYTQNTEVTGNSMIFPKDETTPWGGTGVQAYWQAEAAAVNQSKFQLGTEALVLHKLMAMVPVTNELIADSSAIGSYLSQVAPERITYKTNEAILFGDGAGKPFGALTNAGNANAPAVIQAKDVGQATNTVSNTNLSGMVSRLLVGQLKNAIWLATPDLLPALEAMTLGNYPIFLPNNNLSESSYGMLKGRPLLLTEHAAAFSSQGDINLLSLKGYRTITKAGGLETATSMHLFFDADATAFRFIFRINGKPILSKPVTPPKSTVTRSHFVSLAAR